MLFAVFIVKRKKWGGAGKKKISLNKKRKGFCLSFFLACANSYLRLRYATNARAIAPNKAAYVEGSGITSKFK